MTSLKYKKYAWRRIELCVNDMVVLARSFLFKRCEYKEEFCEKQMQFRRQNEKAFEQNYRVLGDIFEQFCYIYNNYHT